MSPKLCKKVAQLLQPSQPASIRPYKARITANIPPLFQGKYRGVMCCWKVELYTCPL